MQLVPETPLVCGDCAGEMRRCYSEKYKRWFYACRVAGCKGRVWCHPDGSPLGVPVDAATRLARMQAHAIFDVLWRSGTMGRGEAYRWIAHALGQTEVHMAQLDYAGCRKVIDAVLEHTRRK